MPIHLYCNFVHFLPSFCMAWVLQAKTISSPRFGGNLLASKKISLHYTSKLPSDCYCSIVWGDFSWDSSTSLSLALRTIKTNFFLMLIDHLDWLLRGPFPCPYMLGLSNACDPSSSNIYHLLVCLKKIVFVLTCRDCLLSPHKHPMATHNIQSYQWVEMKYKLNFHNSWP